MVNLIGFPENKLKELFFDWNIKPYRVNQVFKWIYNLGVHDFDLMTDLSKDFRAQLKGHFQLSLPVIREKTHSKDGSIKYLFELEDNSTIECVWMPDENRRTLCISTQVGCRLACSFCLTGTMGLKRNLTSAEVLGQIMKVQSDLPNEEAPSNIVIMGMGEPLDNYDEVVEAVRLMTAPHAMKISTRKITLSTSGLVDQLDKLANENLHVNLAVSLNAADDETRDRIMPINKKYPIKRLLDCLKSFPLKPRRKFTIEYVLLKGINDSHESAINLSRLLKGIPCKINLIPFNPFESVDYEPPTENRVLAFQEYLLSKNYTVFIRKNRGADILGACGQLATQAEKAQLIH